MRPIGDIPLDNLPRLVGLSKPLAGGYRDSYTSKDDH